MNLFSDVTVTLFDSAHGDKLYFESLLSVSDVAGEFWVNVFKMKQQTYKTHDVHTEYCGCSTGCISTQQSY